MIAAVIPTRYRPPELTALLHVLADDVVRVHVLDSAQYGHAIYRMWNAGVQLARSNGATEIAILNDDVRLLPGTLQALATALRSEPDVAVVYPDERASVLAPMGLQSTEGTWGSGGMTGFAFMFKVELPLPGFDEAYGWWYADDAWERDVRAAGYRVCRAVGVPVGHTPNGSASKRWDELAPVIEADRLRWEGTNRPSMPRGGSAVSMSAATGLTGVGILTASLLAAPVGKSDPITRVKL